MSSYVSPPATFGGELRAIKYEPAYTYRYGEDDRYSIEIEPYVSFKLGDSRVALTVSDARDLLEALPLALAQHDYAEFASADSKVVA